jgi:hypothetical protein
MQYDVTSSFTQIVDTEPGQAREVLAQIEPMRSLADRLSALGLDDRALWCEGSEELSYRLIWRFGVDGANALLDWRLSVTADGAGRAAVTLELAGRGSDTDARGRVLSSWPLLEELAEAHARRLARALDDYADEDGYEYDFGRPELRAVV